MHFSQLPAVRVAPEAAGPFQLLLAKVAAAIFVLAPVVSFVAFVVDLHDFSFCSSGAFLPSLYISAVNGFRYPLLDVVLVTPRRAPPQLSIFLLWFLFLCVLAARLARR